MLFGPRSIRFSLFLWPKQKWYRFISFYRMSKLNAHHFIILMLQLESVVVIVFLTPQHCTVSNWVCGCGNQPIRFILFELNQKFISLQFFNSGFCFHTKKTVWIKRARESNRMAEERALCSRINYARMMRENENGKWRQNRNKANNRQ